MNAFLTSKNGVVRWALAVCLLAAAGLSEPGTVTADDARGPGLTLTDAPSLLPVEADATGRCSTLRLLTAEPAGPPPAAENQLRLMNGRRDKPVNASKNLPNSLLNDPWLALDRVATTALRPAPASASSEAPSDTPPDGPWCEVEDASPVEPSNQVVATRYEENQARPRDVQPLLALLNSPPAAPAQAPAPIPRVLPSPTAMLPPDPDYDEMRAPASYSPFRKESRGVPPQLPPRRLPREPSPDEFAPGEPVPQNAPVVQRTPPSNGPYDSDASLDDREYAPRGQAYQDDENYLDYYTESSPRRVPCPAPARCSGAAGPGGWFADRPEARQLLAPRALEARDVALGGWLDQGITAAGNNPIDRYNGVVTFNDRSGEYQMNQLNLFLEREIDTRGGGLDFGGRIDVLYGTDARFVQAADGLESNWSQDERFYQAALPQFYLDAGWNDLKVRMGHFYTILGYESVMAPANFFYSHSYAHQYGEPFTHTGMLTYYDVEEGLTAIGGFSRGVDQFDDTDGRNQLAFLGGINWTGCDKRRSVQFAINSGEQGPENMTTIYSLVGQLHPADWLSWILEHNYGQSTGGNPSGVPKTEWYGLSQYVLCQWSETLGVGTRIEWFCDEDGTRVHGLGDGNRATGPYVGSFYEVTLGLNWQPRPNLILRPEARWDWYHGTSPEGQKPFDAGQRDRQFLYGFDLITQF
ncbi:MAG TPA: outer membrane beta-barrel protein [Thermoguttaceae bacterium]|nr:outer membrane beta-barrel protein [Thermoguttaceae bacterium]